jgi:hypothetical protein
MADEPTAEQLASGEFVRVDGAALRGQMARLLAAMRVSEEHAAVAADILVASDLRGVDTHCGTSGSAMDSRCPSTSTDDPAI